MSFYSPLSKNRTHIWDNPHFIRLIESHQFFLMHPNSVRLHFYVHKYGIQLTDQSSQWGTSTVGQLPRTWQNYLKNTQSPATGNPTHKQLLHIWQQTLPPNYRSLHGRDPITRNMWHINLRNLTISSLFFKVCIVCQWHIVFNIRPQLSASTPSLENPLSIFLILRNHTLQPENYVLHLALVLSSSLV